MIYVIEKTYSSSSHDFSVKKTEERRKVLIMMWTDVITLLVDMVNSCLFPIHKELKDEANF